MAETGSFLINNDVLKKYCGKEPNVVIPDSVTSIGDSSFEECTDLISITIPDSVTIFREGVFCDCYRVTVHAPAGSEAERYARDHDITFVAE